MNEANAELFTVDIGDGIERPLTFPIHAISQAKKAFGSLGKMLQADMDEFMPDLLAAGIQDPAIDAAWITQHVPFQVLMRIQPKVIAAFTGKTPAEYEADLKAAAEAKNGQSQSAAAR